MPRGKSASGYGYLSNRIASSKKRHHGVLEMQDKRKPKNYCQWLLNLMRVRISMPRILVPSNIDSKMYSTSKLLFNSTSTRFLQRLKHWLTSKLSQISTHLLYSLKNRPNVDSTQTNPQIIWTFTWLNAFLDPDPVSTELLTAPGVIVQSTPVLSWTRISLFFYEFLLSTPRCLELDK